ncbi:MAG: M48 family metalloprotease [Candidatus Omnitrophica bacterium]|nr:M48 family metalloprotease [Candidatus Omnitrophota bacterium]
MKCAACSDVELVSTMTRQGVVVDVCPKCSGVWLDKGEIFYFTNTPQYVRLQIEEALQNPRPSKRCNPYTQKPLIELSLFNGDLLIDYCRATQGIWLDEGEINKLPASGKTNIGINLEKGLDDSALQEQTVVPMPLPNLSLVSAMTLVFLYGLLSLVLISLVHFEVMSMSIAMILMLVFAVLQFGLSPFIMDITLRWFYRVSWVQINDLPGHLQRFAQSVCAKNNMNLPRFGIIPDGSPNAFTYGHTPNNARIVITSGLMHLLEPEELEAVVAHEIGHAVHWDMLVMTIANLVPLILYQIYRVLIRMKSRGNDRSALPRYALAIGAYILYIISQYIVLWFSRVREYFADRFSGEVTKNPNLLASALVKIGYGLAGKDKKKGSEGRKHELESIKAMGVFDPMSARSLAITSYNPKNMGGEVDKETLKGAMRWDLWNPWAMYYELHSTHPLIAKRLLALSSQSLSKGSAPYVRFTDKKPESYWDEFFIDLLVSWLPGLVIAAAAAHFAVYRDAGMMKAGVLMFGLAFLIRVFFMYKFSYFPEMNISSLLKKVKVSMIRPVPCTLKGKLIGRGKPGLIWSEDFVIQDDTGIIFLDYKQPLALFSWLFGVFIAPSLIGRDVEITGWYRRAPIPYIELKQIKAGNEVKTCYVFNMKILFAVLLMLAGIVLLFVKIPGLGR